MYNNNPFIIEKIRAIFANEKKINDLKMTYNVSYPEISNYNTPKLWDKLNLKHEITIMTNPMEKERLKIVASVIKNNNLTLLNIGFGSANLEKEYFKNYSGENVRWTGIDISSKSVKEAKKKFPQCTFKKGDILEIKERDSTFNHVISLEVLEHIPPSKILSALSEVFRVVKPKGYFILSVPLNEGLEELIKRGENPNAHVRIYTPSLIKAELEISGFTILKEKTLYAFHNFHNIKTFIAKYIMPNKFQPNNIIIVAQRP